MLNELIVIVVFAIIAIFNIIIKLSLLDRSKKSLNAIWVSSNATKITIELIIFKDIIIYNTTTIYQLLSATIYTTSIIWRKDNTINILKVE